MEAPDFEKTWTELVRERTRLLEHRTNLENELVELRNKIGHLNEVINHLSPLAGILFGEETDIPNLGLTDAIRTVLATADDKMSANDIRDKLELCGYDLSALSAPMQSIYKVLNRITDNSDEYEREKVDGRVYYKKKEEEIPF
jgi:uncharacterized coiled-coil DUF342 family protein